MADATFRTAHSGQDGITPDQRPLLGAAGPDGFYLDCGHSGTGFKTGPAVGLAMSRADPRRAASEPSTCARSRSNGSMLGASSSASIPTRCSGGRALKPSIARNEVATPST